VRTVVAHGFAGTQRLPESGLWKKRAAVAAFRRICTLGSAVWPIPALEMWSCRPMIRHAPCSCGQLALACSGEPVRVSICHCHARQMRTGSPFGEQARFPLEQVKVDGRSTPYVRVGDSGDPATFISARFAAPPPIGRRSSCRRSSPSRSGLSQMQIFRRRRFPFTRSAPTLG